MQIAGKPLRVELTEDLTRYDARLTIGQRGTTIPNCKLSVWGDFDRFVAVQFDCGARLDILYKGLKLLGDDAEQTFPDKPSQKS